MKWIAASAALVGVGATWALGAFHRNSPVFGSVLTRLPTDDRVVALTFDDGPSPAATARVLDVLGSENVPATFFVLGKHADRWPHLVRRAARDGHTLGNHGYSHRKLHLRGRRYVRDDLERGTDAIARAADVRPRFFRAPHGFRSPLVSQTAHALGQRIVGWSLGVWDTDRPGPRVIAERVIRGVHPGSIVLLHDADGYDPDGDRTQTADALPLIIAGLRADGYAFASLAHLAS
jgi:peptidoglycan-N-acetylglucosamine deacetylase